MSHILHFSHANGFAGGSYRVLLGELSKHYHVHWTDRFGHQSHLPVTDNWPNLERELIQHFEMHYQEPVIAVGHSLGGMLSMRVAKVRPDLIKAVIILDVPAFSRSQAFGIRLAKWLKLMDKITPAGRTDGRRSTWKNNLEAFEYFRTKELMKLFDSRCLQDYVMHGTESFKDGIHLRFQPEIEMSIYRTIPHNYIYTKPLTVPASAIGGLSSNVFKPAHGKYMQNRLNMKVEWLPGSHLFPFEHPELTAQTIHQLIVDMGL